jgi:hypothetical protein
MSIETVFIGVKNIDVGPIKRQICQLKDGDKEIISQELVITMHDGQVHRVSMHLEPGSNALAYGEVIKSGYKAEHQHD